MSVLNGSATNIALTVSVLVNVLSVAGNLSLNGRATGVALAILISIGMRSAGLIRLVLYLCAATLVVADSVFVRVYVARALGGLITASGKHGNRTKDHEYGKEKT
jgi:hypothetical protein